MIDASWELEILGKRLDFGGELFLTRKLRHVIFVALGCFGAKLSFDDEAK
jgi:hypothetical protein